MTNQDAESGLELVLDNKKLIIAFAVLIAICGCFFVVGFMEGKRQGFQEGSQTAAESVLKTMDVARVQESKPAADQAQPPKEPPRVDQDLNWYDNVSRREGQPEGITPAPKPSPKPKPAPAAASIPPEMRQDESSQPVTYSVQVGAFRQKEELETRARALRDKGFDCRTESPAEQGQLYLLKVGVFHSRADAVAMQLRLKKSGFSSFIKTN